MTDTEAIDVSNDRVLDAEAIQRLEQLDPSDGQAVVQRVLLTYEKALASALRSLEQAATSGDWSTIAQLAHTLRSSSASVGALRLSRLCSEIERGIRQGEVNPLKSRLRDLAHEGQAVAVAVRQLLVARGYAS